MKDCKNVIQDYLFKINEELWAYSKSKLELDIRWIVPLDVIKNDKEFFEYYKNSNEKFVNYYFSYRNQCF